MKSFKLHILAIAALLLAANLPHAGARLRSISANINPYTNACGTVPAGQMWCVGADGFTVVSPTVGTTGICTGNASTFNGTCVYYISETGTAATASACSATVTGAFDFTTTPPDSGACPYQSTFMNALRTGHPDFLLFKRGDCFVDPTLTSPCTGLAAASTNSYGICNSSGNGCHFELIGASSNAPMLIGAYGQTSKARPKFVTMNYVVSSIGAAGYNLAVTSIDASPSYALRDYTNATYNPGIVTAGASSGTGATTITLSSTPRAAIINSTNASLWRVADLDNPNYWTNGGGTLLNVSSISGAVITLSAALTASEAITSGDRLIFTPASTAGQINFNPPYAANTFFFYMEDVYLTAPLVYQFSGTPTWPSGSVLALYLRRNVIDKSSYIGTRSQGFFIADSFEPSSTLLAEENVIDHAGWDQLDNDCTIGQFLPAKCNGVASTQRYNIYGSPPAQSQDAYNHENCCNASYLRNILTNAQGAGLQLRSGGTAYNNFTARNGNGVNFYSGSIDHPASLTYNVSSDQTYATVAIATVTGVAGNVLTFNYLPQIVTTFNSGVGSASQPFDATNPTGINQSTNQEFTVSGNTITIAGPAVTVSIGDVIYFVAANQPAWGTQLVASSTSNNGTTITNAYPTTLQYNVFTNTILSNYKGGVSNGGIAINSDSSIARASGSVVSNNYIMNQAGVGISDVSEIQGVNGTTCPAGEVGITLNNGPSWNVGDSVVVSGVQPSSMNANGTFTVGSIVSTYICLSGSTFGTGTYTAGTGVVNGGVSWGPNYYYNVATPSTDTRSTPTLFTPTWVSNGTSCPTTAGASVVAGCPSIESYDLSLGGDGTLSHFLDGAKANRKGSWNAAYTAAAANSYIRRFTNNAIPNPSF